jgi:hypothetical protein
MVSIGGKAARELPSRVKRYYRRFDTLMIDLSGLSPHFFYHQLKKQSSQKNKGSNNY